MDRSRTAPLVLLVTCSVILVWSILLIVSPGGSRPVEWLQLATGLALGSYALFAYRRDQPGHSRRCRLILLGMAVAGAIVVLGLAADQRSSRTWARLGWMFLLLGFAGSLVVFWRIPQRRAATLTLTFLGGFLILSGMGLTLNCDPTIQRTWCNPNYEREQVLAETLQIDGDLLGYGRAGGSTGAAQVSYVVDAGASLSSALHLPGNWDFEERELQPNELERGRFTTDGPLYADCHIDARVANEAQGTVLTALVGCGGVG